MINLHQRIIQSKGGLLVLAKKRGHRSAACRTMGWRRDRYYRFQELYEKSGEEA